MLADLASHVGGDDIIVRGIMKPGGDPHLYQPTPGDARMIAESQLVITSGLHLEGWIDDLVASESWSAVVAYDPLSKTYFVRGRSTTTSTYRFASIELRVPTETVVREWFHLWTAANTLRRKPGAQRAAAPPAPTLRSTSRSAFTVSGP